MTNLLETRDDVTIEYAYVCPENQQDSAFHTMSADFEGLATLTYRTRVVYVCRAGEMRIEVPQFDADGEWSHSDTIRYTDDLESIGIDTDEKLAELSEKYQDYDIWQNNSWFEVYSDDYPDGEIYHEFNEAIKGALEFIKDDEYWDDSLEGLDE